LLEQLQVAKESYEHTKEELENHDSNLQSLNDELNSARAKKRPTDEKLEKARDEVRQCEQGIRDLEQGQGDWTASYQSPGTLRNLMKAIEGEARFRQRPVGPMGRHVKLLDPVWGSILEKQSGGTLNGFVVTSKADQNILSELMRRTNHQCPIFIGSEMHINTTAHEPLPDLTTWMRVLNIDNDLVRNQMIVNHMIDQVVLVRERTKGQKFMHDGGVQRKNVKVCFTMADNDPYKGHSITINSSGSISIGPIAAFNGRSRMHADKGAQLACVYMLRITNTKLTILQNC
jgi:chromosome segregation ATPase